MKTLVSGLKRREEITKSWLILKLFFKLRFPAGKCRLNNNNNNSNFSKVFFGHPGGSCLSKSTTEEGAELLVVDFQ